MGQIKESFFITQVAMNTGLALKEQGGPSGYMLF